MNSADGTTTLGSFLQVHTFSHTKMILLTNRGKVENAKAPRKEMKAIGKNFKRIFFVVHLRHYLPDLPIKGW